MQAAGLCILLPRVVVEHLVVDLLVEAAVLHIDVDKVAVGGLYATLPQFGNVAVVVVKVEEEALHALHTVEGTLLDGADDATDDDFLIVFPAVGIGHQGVVHVEEHTGAAHVVGVEGVNVDILDGRAVEGVGIYVGHLRGDGNILQIGAALEGIAANGLQGVG